MKAYEFAEYPSNSSVASGVTLLVSFWFLLATGAILADPVSPYTHPTQDNAPQVTRHADKAATPAARTVAIAPEAHLTVLVEASRGIVVEARREIVVEARREAGGSATL